MDENELKELKEIDAMVREINEMADDLAKTADQWKEIEAEFQALKEREENGEEEDEADPVGENPFRLPEDYPAPREILRQHFPRTADHRLSGKGVGESQG